MKITHLIVIFKKVVDIAITESRYICKFPSSKVYKEKAGGGNKIRFVEKAVNSDIVTHAIPALQPIISNNKEVLMASAAQILAVWKDVI